MKKLTELSLAGISLGMLVGLLAVVGSARAQTPAIPLGAPSGTTTQTTDTSASTTVGSSTNSTTTTGTSSTVSGSSGTTTGTTATTSTGTGSGTGVTVPYGVTGSSGGATTSNAIIPGSFIQPTGTSSNTSATSTTNTTTPTLTAPTNANTNAGTTTGGTTTGSATQTIAPTIAPSAPLPKPMILQIGSQGDALLRGMVVSTTGDMLVVQSWGGSWTVRVGSAVPVVPSSAGAGDLSQIHAGDYVGIVGAVAPSIPLMIDASYVRNWTQTVSVTPTSGGATTASTSTSASAVPAGTTLYTGTVTDTGPNTLTMTGADGTSYTVAIGPNTTVWDTTRTDMPLSSIQQGDSIRINGTLSGTTITATVVRDTSR